MKTLIVMRHGKAFDGESNQAYDARYLLPEGKDMAINLAVALKDQAIKISSIYCSDISRAMQTASLVANISGLPYISPLDQLHEQDNRIDKGKNPFDVFQYLSDNEDNVCLVTHSQNVGAYLRNIFTQEDHDSFSSLLRSDADMMYKNAFVLKLNIDSWSDFTAEAKPTYELSIIGISSKNNSLKPMIPPVRAVRNASLLGAHA